MTVIIHIILSKTTKYNVFQNDDVDEDDDAKMK